MTFTEMATLYRSIGKTKKCTFIFCADHGVAEMNVSAYPQSTTVGMVKNYLINQGGAANAFAQFANSELVVVDVVSTDGSLVPVVVDKPKGALSVEHHVFHRAETSVESDAAVVDHEVIMMERCPFA